MKVEQFFKEWISTRPNLKSEFHDAKIEAMAFAESYHEKQLSIQRVVNWLPFQKKNYDQFTELCKKDRCICLFDDGTECNYNDRHPKAIMTHFREI